MLPGASFFLGMPYGRARAFIDAGLPLALASDYNPGSSPSGDMRFVMALACIKQRLTPEEAFNACTINAAYAMGVEDTLGSITPGKRASLIITEPLPSLAFIPYAHQSVNSFFIHISSHLCLYCFCIKLVISSLVIIIVLHIIYCKFNSILFTFIIIHLNISPIIK